MSKNIPEQVHEWMSKLGKKGAKALKLKVSKKQRREWGKLGGDAKQRNRS